MNGRLVPRMIGVLVNINSAFALGSYRTMNCGRIQADTAGSSSDQIGGNGGLRAPVCAAAVAVAVAVCAVIIAMVLPILLVSEKCTCKEASSGAPTTTRYQTQA
jgi:hypothetical protein